MASFSRRSTLAVCVGVLAVVSLFRLEPAHGQGIIMPGAGAVNRAMAGASTAAAIDAAGAGYWNPATIGALPTD